MEKFEDVVVQDLIGNWLVSGWDTENEETITIEVTWHELKSFAKTYYDFTSKEANDHLLRCGEEETEELLKEYFLKKHSNE